MKRKVFSGTSTGGNKCCYIKNFLQISKFSFNMFFSLVRPLVKLKCSLNRLFKYYFGEYFCFFPLFYKLPGMIYIWFAILSVSTLRIKPKKTGFLHIL